MTHAIGRATIDNIGTGDLAGQFGREVEFVRSQLALVGIIVCNCALDDLRRVRGRVGGSRRHLGVFSRVHRGGISRRNRRAARLWSTRNAGLLCGAGSSAAARSAEVVVVVDDDGDEERAAFLGMDATGTRAGSGRKMRDQL
jgi:hypothetical protein